MTATETPLYDDELASVYDNDSHNIYRDTHRAMLSFLSSEQITTCLDVGCGTGSVLSQVQAACAPKQLFGIDVSEAMLKRAASKVDGFVPILGDYTELQNDKRLRELDLVLASYVLSYTEPMRFFDMVHHSLADDGLFVVATTTMNSHQELFAVASHPLFKLISAGYEINKETAENHLPPNPNNPEHLYEMLDTAGFDVEQRKVNHFKIVFDNGEDLYNFGYEGGWFIEVYKQLNVGRHVKQQIHWSMRACQLFGLLPKPCVSSMETVVVAARKRS